ncbi:MAG TPA: NADH-quinone oxidoreductase subunit N, partial [Terriglobales bacterium]|nr:NADH-quinone oxidoreductase subunit N [Terriglobales bacterium]
QTNFYGSAFYNTIRVDTFSVFFHFVILLVALVVVLTSFEYLEVQRIRSGEYYGLILFGAVGMMLMSAAVELVLIFIALEISSISTYILAGMRRRVAESAESSLKYFLLGSFATAFFLYGVALAFGATGTTNIYGIARYLQGQPSVLAYLAVGLMFVGLGFKVASAPFHVWTPDVYEGSPAPVVALMSTGPKAAAFAVLLRVLFATGAPGWFWMVWISAALSMTLGNIGALVQQNVKRLLAYSSIAHAGYLLVAFAAAKQVGISAAIFYAASYAAMNVGAFAVVSHFASGGEKYVTLDDYSGLGRRSPILAAILTIFLLSLIGIPVTGGFFAKFYVFSAALQSNLVGLTIIGVLNSAIAAYYYLRVVVYMYMRDERVKAPVARIPAGLGVGLAISLIATIYLGVLPGRVLDLAMHGAQDLVK